MEPRSKFMCELNLYYFLDIIASWNDEAGHLTRAGESAIISPFSLSILLKVVIDIQGEFDVIEHLAATAMEHERARTIASDSIGTVRGKHQTPIGTFFKQL